MPYSFTYDFSKFVKDITRIIEEKRIHKRIGKKVRDLDQRFRLSNIIGLDIPCTTRLLEDLIEIQTLNISSRDKFLTTSKRVLLLPHCSRKYMDSQCKAVFDVNVPSYYCQHCSSDCLISKATILGENKGYAVYVLPGGSCIPKLLKKNNFEGVAAIACPYEIAFGYPILKKWGIPIQALTLTKNGCAQTHFNLENLQRIL